MSDQEDLPCGLEAATNVARVLDEARIPSVLMGCMAVCLYKDKPNNHGDITFVIPDKLIDAAKNALLGMYPLCTKEDCVELLEERENHPGFRYSRHLRYHTRPQHHFHAGFRETVYLIRQSELLWWLPDLQPGLPDLTVSTDPSLPSSGLWVGKHPVKVLKPACFVQAILWLWMRDIQNSKLFTAWENFAYILASEWDGNRNIPQSRKRLQEGFQQAWDYYCSRYPDYNHKLYCDFPSHGWLGPLYLREKLIEEGRFLSELPKIDLPEVPDLKM